MHQATDITCPVLQLATEYDTLAGQHAETRSEEVTQALVARMTGLALAAGELTPTSQEGAAFQIMLAAAEVDTIPLPDDELKSQVRMSKRIVKHLVYRALDALRDDIARFPDARDFMMLEELDPRAGQKN
jgi:hypothetical protein